jgi:hypothetical protein
MQRPRGRRDYPWRSVGGRRQDGVPTAFCIGIGVGIGIGIGDNDNDNDGDNDGDGDGVGPPTSMQW